MPRRGPIQTEEIIDGSVTTPKIPDTAITTPKIANLAVKGAKIAGVTIAKGKLISDTIRWSLQIPIIAETARTGLSATTVGIRWTGIDFIFTAVELECLKGAFIEATWVASHADSITAIQLFDVTAGIVRAFVSGNTGTNIRSTVGTIVSGNLNHIRVNVTTASVTAGATTGCTKCVLILLFGAS